MTLLCGINAVIWFQDNVLCSDVDLAIDCPNASASEWQVILDEVKQAETLLLIDWLPLDKFSFSKKTAARTICW